MKHRPPIGSTPRARQLRQNATDAEKALWALLRKSFPDVRFRRQVPIRSFIADFASHKAKLVIELDGGQHNAEVDAGRTRLIEGEGYRVIRFWNHEVLGNPEGVWRVIDDSLKAPPLDGEGLGRGGFSEAAPPVINSTPTQPPPSRGRG